MAPEDLGRRIAQQRRASNLRQADLAAAVGMTRVGIACIETGRHGTSLTTLFAIAHALGTTPATLLADGADDDAARRDLARLRDENASLRRQVGQLTHQIDAARAVLKPVGDQP